jgi:hypothetical protein
MDRRPSQPHNSKGDAMSRNVLFVLLLAMGVVPVGAEAQAKPQAVQTKPEAAPVKPETQTKEDNKLISVPGGKSLGMSILGNQEAPKALVIVPWKSSELGTAPGVSMMLDDSRMPIDKEVFMRMLNYYEIRSETARPSGAPTNVTAQPAPAPQRRKP